MAQVLNLKIHGLFTHPNDLSEVPQGALAVADDVVINRESIIEPRRGFDKLTYAFSSTSDRTSSLFSYQDKILVHYGTTKLAWYDSGSGWTDYSGSFSAPTGVRMRSAQSNSNFFFTTSDGVLKLDTYNGTVISAGMYKGLDVKATLSGASGFMSNNVQVAYRVIWGYKDANNNIIYGAPSQRAVVSNSTGGTRDVSLTITIPTGVTTEDFYQVYRSGESASSTDGPNDELGLVYEGNPSSAEIAAKSITLTDSTPDSLRAATIYTADSQEGILQANEVPPYAEEIAVFKDSTFYANTVSKHRLYLTILSVGGTSGVAVDDVITIAGTIYTGKAAESVASREFEIVTSGTPSQNIADTANSLIRVINQNSTNTSVYAYYLSGPDDLPGKILIEERGIGGSSFVAIASTHGSAYNPQLPTSGTTVSSTNDTFLNGMYYSKKLQPEAVPLLNVFRLGSADKKILRTIALRDSLFVLKEDGVWRVTGDGPTTFRQEPFDLTTKLVAPETAVALNNQIYCLSDQGVVAITDTGVEVMSRPIERTLLELTNETNLTATQSYAFAIPYETERKYILFCVTNSGDTYATQAYVYNTFTQAWTRWVKKASCGIVDPVNDKLYLGDGNTHNVLSERKSGTFRDYIDEGISLTINSSSGTSVVLSDISDVVVGDLVYQSDTINSVITALDAATSTATVANTVSWTNGACTVYKAIDSVVEWVPQAAGNSGMLKQWPACTLLFKNNYFTSASLGFYSELSGSLEEVNITGAYGGSWGLFAWGSLPWGGIQRTKPFRTYVPLEKQMCDLLSVRFSHRTAYGRFAIQGISLFTTGSMSDRVTR